MFDTNNLSFMQKFYYFITLSIWIIYLIALTGVVSVNPAYITSLDTLAKFYVAIFLIMRFNPFIKNLSLTKFDKDVVWSAGIFLLLSSTITIAIRSYFSDKFKLVI